MFNVVEARLRSTRRVRRCFADEHQDNEDNETDKK
jgi:hypothetical protein